MPSRAGCTNFTAAPRRTRKSSPVETGELFYSVQCAAGSFHRPER